MDHRDVVLQAVKLRYCDDCFMKVGSLPVSLRISCVNVVQLFVIYRFIDVFSHSRASCNCSPSCCNCSPSSVRLFSGTCIRWLKCSTLVCLLNVGNFELNFHW
jgi:hypothetical protein